MGIKSPAKTCICLLMTHQGAAAISDFYFAFYRITLVTCFYLSRQRCPSALRLGRDSRQWHCEARAACVYVLVTDCLSACACVSVDRSCLAWRKAVDCGRSRGVTAIGSARRAGGVRTSTQLVADAINLTFGVDVAALAPCTD